MDNSYSVLVLIFMLFSVAAQLTYSNTKPGLQVRLMQSGLQYAVTVGTNILSEEVKTISIPDSSGTKSLPVGKVEYEISNIRIKSFAPSNVTIMTHPITWTLYKTHVAMSADWWYKYKKAFIVHSDSGSLDLSLDVHIDTSIYLGGDKTGRLNISAKHCAGSVTHVNVHFHGGASWLYNLFDGKVEDKIQNALQQNLCSNIKDFINKDAAAELATLPIVIDVYDDVMLDYSLVNAPVLTSSYVDVMFKGEFFWKADKQECPYVPQDIDTNVTGTRMVNFWVTEYSVNTLGYAAFKHNVLVYNLTKADLPKKERFALNTTCLSLMQPCIGEVVPQLGKLYPNSDVWLNIRVTTAPVIDVTPSGVQTHWTAMVAYYVITANNTSAFLFSTKVNISFDLTVKLVKLSLTAHVQSYRLNMSLVKSSIGDIHVSALTFVMDLALAEYVIPRLNVVGATGFELPSLKHLTYENPEFQMLSASLFVAVDLKYEAGAITAVTPSS